MYIHIYKHIYIYTYNTVNIYSVCIIYCMYIYNIYIYIIIHMHMYGLILNCFNISPAWNQVIRDDSPPILTTIHIDVPVSKVVANHPLTPAKRPVLLDGPGVSCFDLPKCMHAWMDSWMDGPTDDGRTDGRMHACMHACMRMSARMYL